MHMLTLGVIKISIIYLIGCENLIGDKLLGTSVRDFFQLLDMPMKDSVNLLIDGKTHHKSGQHDFLKLGLELHKKKEGS